MNNLEGFLIVNRINYFTDDRFASKSQDVSNNEHDKILNSYKGIEGEPWPIEPDVMEERLIGGLAPIDIFDSILEYYDRAKEGCHCDFLYILKGKIFKPLELIPSGFEFVGFDYGFYESEYNLYSVLFHEVIYGKYEELRKYRQSLNQNLLAPSMEIIDSLEKARQKLLSDGADLETTEEDEFFSSFQIFLKKEI